MRASLNGMSVWPRDIPRLQRTMPICPLRLSSGVATAVVNRRVSFGDPTGHTDPARPDCASGHLPEQLEWAAECVRYPRHVAASHGRQEGEGIL